MRTTTPKLLGFGLIVLVLAWYGFRSPDDSAEGVPSADDTVAMENVEQSSAESAAATPVGRQMPAAGMVETASPGSVAPPPETDIECMQAPPPPYPDPMRDGRFDSEPEDAGWALQTESTLWTIAGSLSEVKSLECRTTFCVATLAYSAAVRDLDPETRRAQARNKVKLLDETMRAFIEASDGRLGHYACRSVGAPFEGFEFDFYVYGPPRAVAE